MFLHSQAVMFEVLDHKVKSKHDVFDSLIRVRHGITREEGYLLCSHRSEFPTSKIEKATWLAGCYTPEGQEDLPLVFGAIPDQRVHYKVDMERRTLILSIRGESRAHREQLRAELEATRLEQQSAPANIVFDEDAADIDREFRLIEIREGMERLRLQSENAVQAVLEQQEWEIEYRRIRENEDRRSRLIDRVATTFYGLMAVVIVGFAVNHVVNPSNVDEYYCTIEEDCP